MNATLSPLRHRTFLCAAAALAAVPLAAATPAGPPSRTPAGERGVDELIDILASGDTASRSDLFVAGRELRAHHERVCRELIALIQPDKEDKLPEAARATIAAVLGKFRCAEAAEALAAGLGEGPFPEPYASSGAEAYRFAVVSEYALRRIGRPAVPALIQNLQNPSNKKCRYNSLSVLRAILGGKRRLVELIAKLQKQAADQAVAKRLAEARRLTERMPDDKDEPLY